MWALQKAGEPKRLGAAECAAEPSRQPDACRHMAQHSMWAAGGAAGHGTAQHAQQGMAQRPAQCAALRACGDGSARSWASVCAFRGEHPGRQSIHLRRSCLGRPRGSGRPTGRGCWSSTSAAPAGCTQSRCSRLQGEQQGTEKMRQGRLVCMRGLYTVTVELTAGGPTVKEQRPQRCRARRVACCSAKCSTAATSAAAAVLHGLQPSHCPRTGRSSCYLYSLVKASSSSQSAIST